MVPVTGSNETVFGCIIGVENKANIRNLETKINENHQTIITAVHDTLSEVKYMADEWIYDYNHHRPHAVLGKLSPIEYLDLYNQSKNCSDLSGTT